MGKRLIISEEERSEIRGKYNLTEQISSGNFNVNDTILYTPAGGELQQLVGDVKQKFLGGENKKMDVYDLVNNDYVKSNRKIGLSTAENFIITKKVPGGYYAKPENATNTFIFIDNMLSKQFKKVK